MGKESDQENYQSRSARTRWQNPDYRARMKARHLSAAQIAAIRLSNSTRIISADTRKKISDANLKRLEDPDFVAKMSGWQHTEKSKKKMKQSHRDNWDNSEYRARVGAAVGNASRERARKAREIKRSPNDFYPLSQMLVDGLRLKRIEDMPKKGRLISKAAIIIDSLGFEKLSLVQRKALMVHVVWTQNKANYSPILEFLGETKDGVDLMLDLVRGDDDLIGAFERTERLFEAVTETNPDKRPSVVRRTVGHINSFLQEGKSFDQALNLTKSSN